jgi:hypothetical protein
MWAVAQSLLFAAGLRPTPAQATAVSWVSYMLTEMLKFQADSTTKYLG